MNRLLSNRPPEYPLVSVVLPIRNEESFIARCLASVLAQSYPADRMEIIVADGMSTDGTREIVNAFRHLGISLRMVDNPKQIVPTGLNAAIACARGDIIVRVDGHCEIAPDYVAGCVRHLRTGVEAVGGPLDTIGHGTMARAIALAMSSQFGVGNAAFRTTTDRTEDVDTVAFPSYWRSVVDRLGPFDEELVRNQDDEYNYRLRKHGGRILLAADVRASYFSRSSLKSLARQYFQYGYWKVRVLQKHPRQMRSRQFIPPLFVAALIVGSMAALFSVWAAIGLAVMVTAYVAACASASVTRCQRDVRMLALLPVIFATLHVAYGSGFLTGLVRFGRRWMQPAVVTTSPAV